MKEIAEMKSETKQKMKLRHLYKTGNECELQQIVMASRTDFSELTAGLWVQFWDYVFYLLYKRIFIATNLSASCKQILGFVILYTGTSTKPILPLQKSHSLSESWRHEYPCNNFY